MRSGGEWEMEIRQVHVLGSHGAAPGILLTNTLCLPLRCSRGMRLTGCCRSQAEIERMMGGQDGVKSRFLAFPCRPLIN